MILVSISEGKAEIFQCMTAMLHKQRSQAQPFSLEASACLPKQQKLRATRVYEASPFGMRLLSPSQKSMSPYSACKLHCWIRLSWIWTRTS